MHKPSLYIEFRIVWLLLPMVLVMGGGRTLIATTTETSGVDAFVAQQPNDQAVRASQHLEDQIWRSRITALKEPSSETSEEIADLIKRIKSMQYQPPQVEPTEPVVPDKVIEPNPVPVSTPVASVVTTPSVVTTSVSEQAMTLWGEILTRLQKVDLASVSQNQALHLADFLYESNYLDQAYPFYGHVASMMDPNMPLYKETLSWAIFQAGNCLREIKPDQAMTYYQRVVTEFPDAPFAELAQARFQLAKFYWEDKPIETLEQVKQSVKTVAGGATTVAGES